MLLETFSGRMGREGAGRMAQKLTEQVRRLGFWAPDLCRRRTPGRHHQELLLLVCSGLNLLMGDSTGTNSLASVTYSATLPQHIDILGKRSENWDRCSRFKEQLESNQRVNQRWLQRNGTRKDVVRIRWVHSEHSAS